MATDPPLTTTVELPSAGFVYAFHTSPHNAFSPKDTGRYAAMAVLGVLANEAPRHSRLAVGLLAGLWPALPMWEDVCTAPLLTKARPGWVKQAATYCVPDYFWIPSDLRDCSLIGTERRISQQDEAEVVRLFDPRSPVADARLSVFDEVAEGEWRWANDRGAFEGELLQVKRLREAQRAAYEDRVKNRLSQLTWDRLLAETPFDNWTPSPPFPPAAFVLAARRALHDTGRQLAALGPKPKKTAVRKLLRQCVSWFNEANARAGLVIETDEREAICAVLEEMAFLAGHQTIFDEVDDWREW